jgi:hypothetical protein
MKIIIKLSAFFLISLPYMHAAVPENLVSSDSIVLLAREFAEQISSEPDIVVGIYSCFRFEDFDSVFGFSAAADNSIPKRPMPKLRGTGADSERDPVPDFLRTERLTDSLEIRSRYKDRTVFNLKRNIYGASFSSVIVKMQYTPSPSFLHMPKRPTLFTGREHESFLLILRKDPNEPKSFFYVPLRGEDSVIGLLKTLENKGDGSLNSLVPRIILEKDLELLLRTIKEVLGR